LSDRALTIICFLFSFAGIRWNGQHGQLGYVLLYTGVPFYGLWTINASCVEALNIPYHCGVHSSWILSLHIWQGNHCRRHAISVR
jgi:hypothetical protein